MPSRHRLRSPAACTAALHWRPAATTIYTVLAVAVLAWATGHAISIGPHHQRFFIRRPPADSSLAAAEFPVGVRRDNPSSAEGQAARRPFPTSSGGDSGVSVRRELTAAASCETLKRLGIPAGCFLISSSLPTSTGLDVPLRRTVVLFAGSGDASSPDLKEMRSRLPSLKPSQLDPTNIALLDLSDPSQARRLSVIIFRLHSHAVSLHLEILLHRNPMSKVSSPLTSDCYVKGSERMSYDPHCFILFSQHSRRVLRPDSLPLSPVPAAGRLRIGSPRRRQRCFPAWRGRACVLRGREPRRWAGLRGGASSGQPRGL